MTENRIQMIWSDLILNHKSSTPFTAAYSLEGVLDAAVFHY